MKPIIISSKSQFKNPELVQLLEGYGTVFYQDLDFNLNNAVELFDDEEKILAVDEVNIHGGFDAINEVLPKMKNVKYIIGLSARYDNFDIETAKKLKIKYCNNPDTTSESVAELAIMLMMMIVRKYPLHNASDFYGIDNLGREVSEMSAGVIGYGNIGKRIAGLCNGLGMKVKYWNRSEKRAFYIQVDELHKILVQDIVFISLQTNDDTKKLFTQDFFESLRPNQFIVDTTASDALYDKSKLISMANKGKIAGFAFEAENKYSKYTHVQGNVVITPHIGWGTEDSYSRLYNGWARTIIAALHDEPINEVY